MAITMQTKKKAPIVVSFAGQTECRRKKPPQKRSPSKGEGGLSAKPVENRAVNPRNARRKPVPETTVEFAFGKRKRMPKSAHVPPKTAPVPRTSAPVSPKAAPVPRTSAPVSPKAAPTPQKSALEIYTELVAIFAACRQACNENRVKKLRVGGNGVYDPKTGFCKLQKLEKFSKKDKLPRLPKLKKLPKAPKAKKVKFKKTAKK